MTNMSDKAISIDGSVFKRAGAWFGLFQRGHDYGGTTLFLGTSRGMSAVAPEKIKLINIFPAFSGQKVPFTVEAAPSELTVVTHYGNIRFTFANKNMLIAEGDRGMGLLFEKTMVRHETVHPRKNSAWEAFFRLTCAVVFKGLEGSSFDFNEGVTPWKWELLSSDEICGRTYPGPDGRFTLVMEESVYAGVVRDTYPSFQQAKASMQAEWESFYNKMPAFRAPFEEKRLACQYTLWSLLMSPSGRAKYSMIQMFPGYMASQWQMCQNAVALQEHIQLAVDLMLSPIDGINELGQLTDSYDDTIGESLMIKPPMHGWAIKQIMKHHDLVREVSPESLEKLYSGMGKWADWFMIFRDEDEDGLPSIIHSDETGLDDCTMFVNHLQLTTPDTSAYLVLLFEALGDLAKAMGKPAEEADAWYQKSKDLLKRLIDILWDGEHFVGMVPGTREKLFSGSIVNYMPAILGDRLPDEIINKMADDLMDTDRFMSPWGLASQDMSSDYFATTGFGHGCILPPSMIYICTGLFDSCRRETAIKFAEDYLNGLRATDFAFFINPKTGEGSGKLSGSWPRCAYTVLACMLSEKA